MITKMMSCHFRFEAWLLRNDLKEENILSLTSPTDKSSHRVGASAARPWGALISPFLLSSMKILPSNPAILTSSITQSLHRQANQHRETIALDRDFLTCPSWSTTITA